MNEYIIDRYDTLHFIFHFGWVVYGILLVIVPMVCMNINDNKNDRYKGQKIYYAIIFMLLLFLIGFIGTILLPSPELMKVWFS